MQRVICIHPDDSMLVALADLAPGEVVTWNGENILVVHAGQDQAQAGAPRLCRGRRADHVRRPGRQGDAADQEGRGGHHREPGAPRGRGRDRREQALHLDAAGRSTTWPRRHVRRRRARRRPRRHRQLLADLPAGVLREPQRRAPAQRARAPARLRHRRPGGADLPAARRRHGSAEAGGASVPEPGRRAHHHPQRRLRRHPRRRALAVQDAVRLRRPPERGRHHGVLAGLPERPDRACSRKRWRSRIRTSTSPC